MLEISESRRKNRESESRESRGAWQDLVPLLDGPIRQGVWRALLVIFGETTVDQVDDLVQDVYCRLLEDGARRLRRFRGTRRGELRCYVRLTARRVVLDHLRAARAVKRGGGSSHHGIGLEDPADSGPTPEERAMIAEARDRFFRGCRTAVSPRNAQRDLAILKLIFVEGWTSREVANGWPEPLTVSSVDSIVFRVRKKLMSRGLSVLPRDGRQRKNRAMGALWSPVH